MKSKLKFIAPLIVLAFLGVTYTQVLAKPSDKEPKPKVDGELYVLPKDFLVNLKGNRYAKVTVALLLPHHVLAEAGAEEEAEGSEPPEGFGILAQEAVVRAIVTDALSGARADTLLDADGREASRKKILEGIHKKSDVEVEDVLLTDVAVQ